MAFATARITGPVTQYRERSGEKNGRAWSFTEVTILSGGRETVQVILGDNVPVPEVGSEVDYLIQVSARAGSNPGQVFLGLSAVSAYPVNASIYS
jgi:hypothetical protein